jgi:hypothetical protein
MNGEALELMMIVTSLARTLEYVLCPQSWWLDCDSGCWHMSTPQPCNFGDGVAAGEDGARKHTPAGAAWTAVEKGVKIVQPRPEPCTTCLNRFAVLSDEDMSCEEADDVSRCCAEPLVKKLKRKKVRIKMGLTGEVAAQAERAVLPDEGSSSGGCGKVGAQSGDIGDEKNEHVVGEVCAQSRAVLPDEGSRSSDFGGEKKDVRVVETCTDAESLMAGSGGRDGELERTHDDAAAIVRTGTLLNLSDRNAVRRAAIPFAQAEDDPIVAVDNFLASIDQRIQCGQQAQMLFDWATDAVAQYTVMGLCGSLVKAAPVTIRRGKGRQGDVKP